MSTVVAALLLVCARVVCGAGARVVFAVNCGGSAFTDSAGVLYASDPLLGLVGTASDYGRQLVIERVLPQDRPLYQTERYHHNTFSYDLPALADGDYVLVLKFSEVYFDAPNQKVFDVVLNGEHTVVRELDIFKLVGRGVAHDELIPFSVDAGRIFINGESSDVEQSGVLLEFVKGFRDNPKVNAILLLEGKLEDAPVLPPLPRVASPRKEPVQQPSPPPPPPTAKSTKPSGPRTADPYSEDESMAMLPVFITVAACVPVLFCLCRL